MLDSMYSNLYGKMAAAGHQPATDLTGLNQSSTANKFRTGYAQYLAANPTAQAAQPTAQAVNPLSSGSDILDSWTRSGGIAKAISRLFGGFRKDKVPGTTAPAEAAAPTPTPTPAAPAWQAGVNSVYGNPFGASPGGTTFASMLSRQPSI